MGLWIMGGVFSFCELPAKQHQPMPTPYLKEFIVNVASCTQRMSLAAVLEIFSRVKRDQAKGYNFEPDCLVVLNEQQRPLGLLYLSSLLPYLLATPQVNSAGTDLKQMSLHVTALNAQQSYNQTASSLSSHLQQPLSELGLSIIQPLATLPADFTLQQFWPYLQERDRKSGQSSHYALVDRTGKFLGLLDTQQLLEFIANYLPSESIPNQANPLEAPPESLSGEDFIATQLVTLHPLVQLLEKLPLPMMLQTGSGYFLSQNVSWRKHFGALQDAESIRQEAAALLQNVPPPQENSTGGERQNEPASLSNFDFASFISFPTSLESEQATVANPNSLPKLCQLGGNPNTCICICPMQNGSERVWQFIKIPLGNLLHTQDFSYSNKDSNNKSLEDALSSGNFRLAKIKNQSDNFSISNIFQTAYDNNISGYKTQYEQQKLHQNQENSDKFVFNNDLWLVLATDVTEQQQVAKELAAKNVDLIQLNRLKDEFLACISHELKTPLTAVLGLSSLLKDHLLGDLNERQTRYARLIHQSARHLMTVVNDILDLTRMETGQLELTPATVDIFTVCDRAYQQARQLHLGKYKTEDEEINFSAPEANFTLIIEPGLDHLIADEMRLRQMLVNLLSNALKFTEETGTIGLRVSHWEGWIAFTVSDTGIGIPDQKQHLIFQKFQQLENPLTRQFEGTGLGLVLTQRLARLHGGDVTFISKEGSGSEFTLLLPPSPPRQRVREGERESNFEKEEYPIPNKPLSIPNYQSRMVLIVEGVPHAIENLSHQLLGLGYRVVIARSGTEALEKARRLQPCVIFLNPLLPLLSGWDVLTLLKASPQTQHIPIIVTATRAEKEYAYNKRADSFLTLPVQAEALQQSLDRLLINNNLSGKVQTPSTGLTILRLNTGVDNLDPISLDIGIDHLAQPEQENQNNSHISQHELSRLLHQYNYRVLEADDLEQAELLARIWQPHVVLIEGKIANPLAYMQTLSNHEALASLPLVTMDEATTEAALRVPSRDNSLPLQVFPCLTSTESLPEPSTLLQAIQVAAGMNYKPTILVVDLSTLPDLNESLASAGENLPNSAAVNSDSKSEIGNYRAGISAGNKKRSEWLQALIQYLETAEFKGVIGHSWEEVLRQVQYRSVDLLLIDLGESISDTVLIKTFYTLRQFGQKPPTFILTRYFNNSETPEDLVASFTPSLNFLQPVIKEVVTAILPANLSMEELLERIRQTLA